MKFIRRTAGCSLLDHRRNEDILEEHPAESLKQRDHSEDLGVEGKIILEWILRK
jgi:hypothetical protein